MLVRITKQTGETGLRLPGTLILLNYELGTKWIDNGWAVEVDQSELAGKQLKPNIETKQEQFKQKDKETKRKRVVKTKVK